MDHSKVWMICETVSSVLLLGCPSDTEKNSKKIGIEGKKKKTVRLFYIPIHFVGLELVPFSYFKYLSFCYIIIDDILKVIYHTVVK